MRIAVLAAALAAAALTAPAHADQLVGSPCFLFTVTDPMGIDRFGEPTNDGQYGLLGVNPFLGTGTVRCTVQAGPLGGVHSGPDRTFVSATDDTVPGLIATSSFVNYVSANSDAVYLCAQYTDEFGATRYWNGAGWEASSSAPCEEMAVVNTATSPLGEIITPAVVSLISQCPLLQTIRQVVPDWNGALYIEESGDTWLYDHLYVDCPGDGDDESMVEHGFRVHFSPVL